MHDSTHRARAPRGAVWAALAALLALTSISYAQFPGLENFPAAKAVDGTLAFGFDESTEGWRNLDGGNGLAVDTAAGAAKKGEGALKYDYPVRKGTLSALFRGGLSLAGVRSVSFWVKSPKPGIFAFALIEEDGSNYLTMFGTRGDEWQQMSYDLDELRLSDDSRDENNQLDVNQIRTMGMMDLEAMMAQDAAAAAGQKAPRTLWVDQIQFGPDSVRPPVEGGRALLDDFDTLSGRWGAVRFSEAGGMQGDQQAVVEVTQEAADVKIGKGALLYEYAVTPGGIAALMGSTSLRVKAPKSVSVWLKTSEPTVVGWHISEQDGSGYSAMVPSPGGQWQHVQLSLADFNLDDDQKDENGQLDGDQVNGMGFIDAAPLLGFAPAGGLQTRKLWIDELAASDKEPPTRTTIREVAGGREVVIDSFEDGAATWMSMTVSGLDGGKPQFVQDKTTKIRVSEEGAAAGEGALLMDYFAPEAAVVAFLRFFGKQPVEKATHLRLWIKSKYDAKLMVQLEEDDDSGYNTQLDLLGSDDWQKREIVLSSLKLADDKVDENGKLDLEQLRHMVMIDISGAAGEPGPNTLALDDIAFFVPGE